MCSSFSSHKKMEVGVPNLNVLPICLPFPLLSEFNEEKRQNVFKFVKGKKQKKMTYEGQPTFSKC